MGRTLRPGTGRYIQRAGRNHQQHHRLKQSPFNCAETLFETDFYDIGIHMINDYWLILEVTGLVLAASDIGALTMAKIEREN